MEKLCGSGERKETLTSVICDMGDNTESLVHLNEKLHQIYQSIIGEQAATVGSEGEASCKTPTGAVSCIGYHNSSQSSLLLESHELTERIINSL